MNLLTRAFRASGVSGTWVLGVEGVMSFCRSSELASEAEAFRRGVFGASLKAGVAFCWDSTLGDRPASAALERVVRGIARMVAVCVEDELYATHERVRSLCVCVCVALVTDFEPPVPVVMSVCTAFEIIFGFVVTDFEDALCLAVVPFAAVGLEGALLFGATFRAGCFLDAAARGGCVARARVSGDASNILISSFFF